MNESGRPSCEAGGITYHLKALNFIDSQTFFPSPPRLRGSTQIGHMPTYPALEDANEWTREKQIEQRRTLVGPRPFTTRGVYKSYGERGALNVAPAPASICGAGPVINDLMKHIYISTIDPLAIDLQDSLVIRMRSSSSVRSKHRNREASIEQGERVVDRNVIWEGTDHVGRCARRGRVGGRVGCAFVKLGVCV